MASERRGVLEAILLLAFLGGLLLLFVNYVLGGLDGVGYAWYQGQQAVLDFLSWRVNVYVLALAPTLAVVAYLLRHCLPIIEIPLLGTGNLEARVLKRWYWPGTFRIQEGEATWREARVRAYVNKALIAHTGLWGYLIVTTVERNINDADGEVTYDTAEIAAYQSRTLRRRWEQEVQQRIQQDEETLRRRSP